jgi:hypothetical protein
MQPPDGQTPDVQTPEGPTFDSGELVRTTGSSADVARLPPDVQLATVRQMMETLAARVESLQENQAIQFAGVHDRLDAVELEIPLIQEQSALRIRELETRMDAEIGEAARSAVEEMTAGLQEEVSGKFGSLAAQIESQGKELSEMRESKRLTESRLNRAVQDIERLCGDLSPRPVEEVYRPATETVVSPMRSRIAEHIRRAAVEAAPDESNPLVDGPVQHARATAPRTDEVQIVARTGPELAEAGASAPADTQSAALLSTAPAPDVSPSAAQPAAAVPVVPPAKPVLPGFDDWKRQFMQEGEPLNPVPDARSDSKARMVICPRCFSERTRPAARGWLDRVYRVGGFTPHRCRSCSHRFYVRGAPESESPFGDGGAEAHIEEAIETR